MRRRAVSFEREIDELFGPVSAVLLSSCATALVYSVIARLKNTSLLIPLFVGQGDFRCFSKRTIRRMAVEAPKSRVEICSKTPRPGLN